MSKYTKKQLDAYFKDLQVKGIVTLKNSNDIEVSFDEVMENGDIDETCRVMGRIPR